MNLLDLVRRPVPPAPWSEGEKIPWNDPAFSARMLQEHLSQTHDAASRRAEKIDAQVAWIHQHLLGGRPARVLDLGCGPGLYTSRLARLGHTCHGIDFGPASVAYAVETAAREGLSCTYRQEDIRRADYGSGWDLVMLIYGEFNTFHPADAEQILRQAHAALRDGGTIVLEPHTYDYFRQAGREASWYTTESGLFSDRPHLYLYEKFWDEATQTTIERYMVVDAAGGQVARYACTMQAYTDAGYRDLLARCGFIDATIYPSLTGEPDPSQAHMIALAGHKPGASR